MRQADRTVGRCVFLQCQIGNGYGTGGRVVNRRSVLSLVPVVLAGCAGSGVETLSRPRGPPNFIADVEWLSGRSAYRVTFERGNVVTDEHTDRVVVFPDPGEHVEWVGGDDAVAEFPLEPGASIVVPAPEVGRVRVVWESRHPRLASVLDSWSSDGGDGS